MADVRRSVKRAIPDATDLRVIAYGFIYGAIILIACGLLGVAVGLFVRAFNYAAFGG